MKRGVCIYRCLLLVGLLLAVPLLADTITLKNGTKLEGEITGQDRTSLQIRLKTGQVRIVLKTEVQRLQYGQVDPKLVEEERKRQEAELKKKKEEEKKKTELENKKKEEEKVADQKKDEKIKSDAVAAEKERIKNLKSPWSPVWRSAILPGWGMFYMKRQTPGIAYSSIFGVALINTYLERKKSIQAKTDYDNNVRFNNLLIALPNTLPVIYYVDAQEKINYRRSVQKYNTSFQLMSLIYAIQLTHSFFAGRTWAASAATDFVNPVANQASLEFRFDFPL